MSLSDKLKISSCARAVGSKGACALRTPRLNKIILNMSFGSLRPAPRYFLTDDSHKSATVKSRSVTRRSGRETFSKPVPTLHVRFLDVLLAHNFSEKRYKV